jgi:hypothetical protein
MEAHIFRLKSDDIFKFWFCQFLVNLNKCAKFYLNLSRCLLGAGQACADLPHCLPTSSENKTALINMPLGYGSRGGVNVRVDVITLLCVYIKIT